MSLFHPRIADSRGNALKTKRPIIIDYQSFALYPLRETNLLGDYIVYQYVPVFVIILGSRKDRALFSPYFLHYLCFTA